MIKLECISSLAEYDPNTFNKDKFYYYVLLHNDTFWIIKTNLEENLFSDEIIAKIISCDEIQSQNIGVKLFAAKHPNPNDKERGNKNLFEYKWNSNTPHVWLCLDYIKRTNRDEIIQKII